MNEFEFDYHFYPVGQGLFSTGTITRHGKSESRFLWVYDCGTSSSKQLVEDSIKRLHDSMGNRKRIDLLVLSHFDNDHISGVCELLRKFKIGTLMLPYMSLAQRLVLAFEEDRGGVDGPMSNFCLNPVEFLLTQDGLVGIERILFIPPSGSDGPAYTADVPRQPESGSDDPPDLEIEFEKRRDGDVDNFVKVAQQKKASVDYHRPGSRINVPSYSWEFIPYNDDPEESIPDVFIEQVEAERADLLSAATGADRKESLRKLKRAYDEHFGAGSEERNVISLFLYSGPIYPTWTRWRLWEGQSISWPTSRWIHRFPFAFMYARYIHELPEEPSRHRCSILYTGDGYLDTKERLNKLIGYLDERRVLNTGVFQVMHHGAETNWHQGTAAAISPLFSVFSSDPERKEWKHPHASVLRDFWRFGAVQVDKKTDFTAFGHLSNESGS